MENPGAGAPPALLRFSSAAIPLEAIKKALYRCADKGSFELEIVGNEILVRAFASPGIELEALASQVRTEILDQDLREAVAKETAETRTLILANAFSKTTLIE